jgi:hypothetical protein
LGNPKSASELSFKCRCAETSARQRQARELIVIVRFCGFSFVERGRLESILLLLWKLCHFALHWFRPNLTLTLTQACRSSFLHRPSRPSYRSDNRSPLPTARNTPFRRSPQESAMGEDQKAGKRAVAVGDEPVVLQETPAKHATPPSLAQTKWNTDKLGLRIGSDALAAGAAGALVAPIITIIDKGIMENASGRHPLGESLKKSARELLLKPHHFLTSKPFALIFVRSSPVHPRHSRKASASKHKLIRAVRLSTSAPTSPPTQSTPSPPRAHKPPSPQPPPAPRSSPSPRPPTSPCASTKTTNSPSSSAHPDPNGPFRSPHSPSSPCATASPSSPRSTCRPCSRPSWRRRWARR